MIFEKKRQLVLGPQFQNFTVRFIIFTWRRVSEHFDYYPKMAKISVFKRVLILCHGNVNLPISGAIKNLRNVIANFLFGDYFLTLMGGALILKIQLLLLFKPILHHDALLSAKYFSSNLLWVTNYLTILYAFNKNFKITLFLNGKKREKK